MSQSTTVRTAIANVLGGIPDIGRVHVYERYASKASALKALYVWQGQLRGWHVRRVRQRRSSTTLGRYVVTTRWQIRGFLALADESQTEQTMDELVDAITAAFDADEELGGTVDTTVVDNESGIQLEDSGPYMFAGVLCHGVRLGLNTRHLE